MLLMAMPMMAISYRQVVRCFSTSTQRLTRKINIQRPRVPSTERRILNALSVPIFPPDPRPLPQQCYDEMKKKEDAKCNELTKSYLAFRLNQATKMFHENKMVIICHNLPVTSRDSFNVRTKIVTAGMKLMFVRNEMAIQVIQNTRLQNLKPYLVSDNCYIVSEKNMLSEIVAILKKTPELQLLGGLVEDRIMSREDILNAVKLPPLDILRGQMLTLLSASASRTSHLLSRHQQELSINLDQLVKQGGGLKQESDGVDQNSLTEGISSTPREAET